MLRKRNSWKDIAINWVVMLLVICPLGVLGMLGFIWGSFKLLGAI
tara:strand:+ start:246 stop:380 length:135 start_codon:yes stop_codon:yes gene_type:complete